MKLTKATGTVALIEGIILALYNIILFTVGGFTGHGASYWISYAIMMIGSILAFILFAAFIGRQKEETRLFITYPIAKYSVVYFALELVVSVIFIVLDGVLGAKLNWSISFIVQLILIAAYVILAITCFFAKTTVVDVQNEIKAQTVFVKLLYTDAAMLAESCKDEEAKKQFEAFAEAVRYSDPVSNPVLAGLEGEIQSSVTNAKLQLESGDVDGAIAACNRATLLLKERNMKCKALK